MSNPRASSGICVSVFANWLLIRYGNPSWLSTRRSASYRRNPELPNKAQFSAGPSGHNLLRVTRDRGAFLVIEFWTRG